MNLNRYDRQMKVMNFGAEGQEKLSQARVLIVGAGGLGAACLPYLAGAGIGHISIMDADLVELSNLHRQTLYSENDIGQHKAEVAARKLSLQNSQISVVAIKQKLAAHNALAMAKEFDLIVDCTDNYNAKYAMNDACVAADIPMVSASIEGMSGYLGVFGGKGYANYRSLFNEPALNALNCADSGVLGSVAGIFGVMQAHEVIKYFTGVGEVAEQVIMLDLYDFTSRKIQLSAEYLSEFRPFDIVILNDVANRQLLDVREADEFAKSHFKGAVNWPLSEISDNVGVRLGKDQPLVLYCAKGTRAEKAAIYLQRAGHTNLALLDCGMS